MSVYSRAVSLSEPIECMLLGVLNALEFLVTEDFFCQQGKAHLTQGLLALLDSVSPAIQQAAQRVCQRYCDEGAALMASGVSTSTDLRIQLYNAHSHRLQRVERAKSSESLRSRAGNGAAAHFRPRPMLNLKKKGSSSGSRQSKDHTSSSKQSKDHTSSSKQSKDHSSSSRGATSHGLCMDNQSSIFSDGPVDATFSPSVFVSPPESETPRYVPVNRATLVSPSYNGLSNGSNGPNGPNGDSNRIGDNGGNPANVSESEISPVEESESPYFEKIRAENGNAMVIAAGMSTASPAKSHDYKGNQMVLNSDSSEDELVSHKYTSTYSESEEESPERRQINEIASVFHVFIQLYQSCSYICIIQRQYSVLYEQLLKVLVDINQFVALFDRIHAS